MNRRRFLAISASVAVAPAAPKANGRFVPVGDIIPAQPNARTYTTRDQLPLHPNCRCVWILANPALATAYPNAF
jgi:hypothetical protein